MRSLANRGSVQPIPQRITARRIPQPRVITGSDGRDPLLISVYLRRARLHYDSSCLAQTSRKKYSLARIVPHPLPAIFLFHNNHLAAPRTQSLPVSSPPDRLGPCYKVSWYIYQEQLGIWEFVCQF